MRLHGPGKYDDLAQLVHEATGGNVVLIVMGGYKGHGIAMKADAQAMQIMPKLLRNMADALQEDLGAGGRP